ncbi:hypothetical protein [Bifidobacterium sp.]|jgi:hypothetical protein|uniref:hypothetical protein n=1 Tax=Bifidobacterium sp. TaxID=41200 RepID=UPI0025B9E0D8|nr:hypothetical protein [Bifidobacterium sp.]MCI1634980.1 hypothetical protein [Bifidobacterium sp.]
MVQIIIGVLLLVAFFGLIVYAFRGGNLMLGMLIMAIIWASLSIIGFLTIKDPSFVSANKALINTSLADHLKAVFQSGPESWGPTLVNFIFGAWFGRVMLKTGIASKIIKLTVELGGDKPVVTSIMLSIVTTFVFSSMFGAGAVVAIGVIVFPILLSLGIPKKTALVSFMLAVGAGLYINPVIFSQYKMFYLDSNGNETVSYDSQYLQWGFIALAVQLLIAIIYTIVFSRKKRQVHQWASPMPKNGTGATEGNKVPGIALITPFVPVVLAIAFGLPVIFGFLVAGFFALAVCGFMRTWKGTAEVFNKTFYDGVIDTAPLMGFMLIIPMFNAASSLAVPYFQSLLGGIIPNSTLVVALAFAIIAPLGLFRGPLTLAGAGSATLGILKSLNFSPHFLFALMYAPTVTMNISSDITQSWIIWGINYTKVETKDYLKSSAPTGWIITAILSAATFFIYG